MGNAISEAGAFEPIARVATGTIDSARTAKIPWYVWCLAAAVTCDAVRWLLGYLVAYLDRPRHVLDSGAHDDLPGRRARGRRKRLRDSDHDLRLVATSRKTTSVSVWGFRGPLGCFIATWGGIRDAHLGAVRQLVAQRVRPRRQNRQPAAFDARVRRGDDQPRRDAAGLRAGQSRRRERIARNSIACCSTSAASRPSAPRCSSSNRRRWSFMHSSRIL